MVVVWAPPDSGYITGATFTKEEFERGLQYGSWPASMRIRVEGVEKVVEKGADGLYRAVRVGAVTDAGPKRRR